MKRPLFNARLFKHIATLGPIGYLPARGTISSLITLVAIWLFESTQVGYRFYSLGYIPYLLIAFFIVIAIVQKALQFFKEADPAPIVLDEVLGMMCALWHIEHTLVGFLAAFLFFRFFDTIKPWPINLAEKLPGALGVVGDDLAAGLFANIATQASLFILHSRGFLHA